MGITEATASCAGVVAYVLNPPGARTPKSTLLMPNILHDVSIH